MTRFLPDRRDAILPDIRAVTNMLEESGLPLRTDGRRTAIRLRALNHEFDMIASDEAISGNLLLTAQLAKISRDPIRAAKADSEALEFNHRQMDGPRIGKNRKLGVYTLDTEVRPLERTRDAIHSRVRIYRGGFDAAWDAVRGYSDGPPELH